MGGKQGPGSWLRSRVLSRSRGAAPAGPPLRPAHPGPPPAAEEGRAEGQAEAAGGRAAGEDGLEAAVITDRTEHRDIVGTGGRRGRLGVLGGPVAVEEVLLQCVHAPTVHPGGPTSPVD
ncbi:hypothetical protein GCM10010519_08440 [Streptomyces lactacystinicus]